MVKGNREKGEGKMKKEKGAAVLANGQCGLQRTRKRTNGQKRILAVRYLSVFTVCPLTIPRRKKSAATRKGKDLTGFQNLGGLQGLVFSGKREDGALRQAGERHALRQCHVNAAFVAHRAPIVTGVFF
jgi:hypothetical protein